MISLQGLARNLEAIKELPSVQRYRIAMQLTVTGSDGPSLSAFSALPVEQQSTMILAKLLEADAVGGPGSATVPPVPEPIARQPDAPQNGYQVGAPVPPPGPPQTNGHYPPPPMQTPPPMGAPGGFGPPPAAQLHAPQQPTVPRTPQTAASMPSPAFSPPAMPPPQSGPIPPPQQAPAAQQTQAAAPNVSGAILASLAQKIEKIQRTLDEEVPGNGDFEAIQETVAAIATGQQTLMAMLWILMPEVIKLPRDLIAVLIKEELEARTAVAALISKGEGDAADSGKD